MIASSVPIYFGVISFYKYNIVANLPKKAPEIPDKK